MAKEKPSLADIFNVMSANETIEKAKELKNPRPLWGEFWIEDEVCCLFADANVGKSILAVQIGNSIAEKILSNGETVLYYDFELSKKQFELRYTDSEGKPFGFSDKFIRVELNADAVRNYCEVYEEQFDDVLMKAIEENINKYNSKVIILDNITWLTNMKNTGTNGSKLMFKLCNLKKKYGISILVLAHTPKRDLSKAITQNSLGGTKAFANFFDAMFAVGKSIVEPSYRYVKQIKVRSAEFKFDSNHVKVCKIEKKGAFLGFTHVGYCSEDALLKPQKPSKEPSGTTARRSAKRGKKRTRRACRDALTATQINTISQMAANAFSKFRYVAKKR